MSSNRQLILLDEFDRAANRARSVAAGNPINRTIFSDLERRLLSFVDGSQPGSQWIIMPGLRGVGKTILLSQLYSHPRLTDSPNKFYLSLDSPTIQSLKYQDLLGAIESRLGGQSHSVKDKVFLFLDEIHFWPGDWSLALKVLYDSFPQLFIVCTGSSALSLNLNPDSARRASVVHVPPLSLTEYILLEAQVRIRKLSAGGDDSGDIDWLNQISQHFRERSGSDLSGQLTLALFGSSSASQVYDRLRGLQPSLDNYWSIFDKRTEAEPPASPDIFIDPYINRYLTLPYAVMGQYDSGNDGGYPSDSYAYSSVSGFVSYEAELSQELQIKDQIQQTLGRVLERDLAAIHSFDRQTRATALDFLRLLADSDTISLSKISKSLSPDRSKPLAINTIRDLLKALKQAAVLNEILPLGSSFGRVSKSSKYLFAAPAIRSALLPLVQARNYSRQPEGESGLKQKLLRGRLLEDTVGMYLKRLFVNRPLPGVLEYDARDGGADFLISRVTDRLEVIPIEVGWSKRSHRQIAQTRRRLKSSPYGLVVTGGLSGPSLVAGDKTVYIPLSLFLLL